MRLRLFYLAAFVLVLTCLTSGLFGQTVKKKKTPPRKTPTILFVCEHGAAKSVIAATYFDKYAQQQGLKYKAVFRGTTPDPIVSPITKQGLKEDGIEIGEAKPSLVTKSDMEQATQIITLGCKLPGADAATSKVTDWSEIPSPSNYPIARDAISKRVQQLVSDLAKANNLKQKK